MSIFGPKMPTPREFFESSIHVWEDMDGKKIYSDNQSDHGNWVGDTFIGSQHGVTAPTLAAHRCIFVSEVTVEMMKSVTLEEAADIAMGPYFNDVGFAKLTWGPATAALADWGWMSGPSTPIRHIQRLCGVPDDGAIGPITYKAYGAKVAALGWSKLMEAVRADKEAFFRSLGQDQFLQGWLNRNNYYSQKNASWWSLWGV